MKKTVLKDSDWLTRKRRIPVPNVLFSFTRNYICKFLQVDTRVLAQFFIKYYLILYILVLQNRGNEQELSSIQLVVLLYTSNCNRNMPLRAVHATIYNIATTTCYSVWRFLSLPHHINIATRQQKKLFDLKHCPVVATVCGKWPALMTLHKYGDSSLCSSL